MTSYNARVNSQHPGGITILLDQSGSTDQTCTFRNTKMRKDEAIGLLTDNCLDEVAMTCYSKGAYKRRLEILALSYADDKVAPAFASPFDREEFIGIDELIENPPFMQRVEGADEPERPGWCVPRAVGSTPMCAVLRHARLLIEPWCRSHEDSFPPLVFNISDGRSTDGNPGPDACELRELHTNDGNLLLFNLHISETGGQPILFPSRPDELPDEWAKQMFEMSSEMPEFLREAAIGRGIPAEPGARCFTYNAGIGDLLAAIQIGTVRINER